MRAVGGPDGSSAGIRSAPAGRGPLPARLAQLSTVGVGALAAGAGLMAVSFLTNPVPDPSFPWATLPAEFRVGYAQPRIEHWPVTYTVGLWLIVFALPLGVLAAYRRSRRPESRVGGRASTWLAALPVALMLGLTTYCRFFWPKLEPATWNAPSYTLVCWGYCATYDAVWSDLAYLVAVGGVGAVVLAYRDSDRAPAALTAFGLLAFPLGAPALYDAYRRRAR